MKVPKFRLDRLYISDQEEEDMLLTLAGNRDYYLSEVIDKASVPEIELYHHTGAKFYICKPKFHKAGYPALLDIYAHDNEDIVFWITLVKNNDKLGFMPNYLDPDMESKRAGQIANITMTLYAGFQFLMQNRPEFLLTDSKEVSQIQTTKTKGKYKSIRKTRVIKVFHLNKDELSKRHNIITCECWGVAGHYRHYKNGKTIFISPYRKGKKRDDPEAYQPKTYQL